MRCCSPARPSLKNWRSGRRRLRATVMLGLSELSGSWKTIWMRRRTDGSRRRGEAGRGAPANSISPAVGSCSPARQRPKVVLPLPLSPTMARQLPLRMSNEAPLTATVSTTPPNRERRCRWPATRSLTLTSGGAAAARSAGAVAPPPAGACSGRTLVLVRPMPAAHRVLAPARSPPAAASRSRNAIA